jgi:N-acetylglucosamine-6-phosphate deacetylase
MYNSENDQPERFMKKTLFHAKVILPDRILPDAGVEIEDGIITKIFEKNDYSRDAAERINCKGLFLSPGFIDIHIHGGGGADVMDGTEESVEKVLAVHAKYGTTAFLLSTLSASPEAVIKALKCIEKVQKARTHGPKIL